MLMNIVWDLEKHATSFFIYFAANMSKFTYSLYGSTSVLIQIEDLVLNSASCKDPLYLFFNFIYFYLPPVTIFLIVSGSQSG